MKKTTYQFTVIALILAMTFALSACGSKEKDTDDAVATPPASEESTEEAIASEEAVATEDTNKADTNIGDLYSGSFAIDSKVFTLPCEIKKFYDLGYSFEKDDTLSDGYSSSGRLRHSNGDSFVVSVFNTTGSDKKFSECSTDSVSFYPQDCINFDIEFPGGIHMNDSIKDVKAAWGEPADLYDEGDAYYMTYEKELDDYEKVEVDFQFFKEEMSSMEMKV